MSSLPNQSFPLPTPPPPPTVLGDLPCRKCSYNLRTLPTTGVCPECGTPVAESIRSDRLADADPHWLRTIRLGVSFLWITWLLYVLWIALGVLLRLPTLEARWIQTLLGRLLQAPGIWLTTTPDPGRQNDSANQKFSFACRTAAIIDFAAAIAWLGVMHRFTSSSPVYFAVRYLNIATEIINRALILFYLSRLMLRIPDLPISRAVWWSAVILTLGSAIEYVARLNPRITYFLYARVPGLKLVVDLFALIGLVLVLNALRLCSAAIRRETR
jgi:hypothetical protein